MRPAFKRPSQPIHAQLGLQFDRETSPEFDRKRSNGRAIVERAQISILIQLAEGGSVRLCVRLDLAPSLAYIGGELKSAGGTYA
jgi:hypothetical protein